MNIVTIPVVRQCLNLLVFAFPLALFPSLNAQQDISFDVTAQFDDFTQVIADGAFVANDAFDLPAGDCHTDLSFALTVTGDIPEDAFLSAAATNLTTGAFLQMAGPDAFGDFVFEMDDLPAGTYSILVELTDNVNPIISQNFAVTINDQTAPVIDIPDGTLSLLSPSVCESDRLQVWSLQASDDCTGEVPVEVVSVTEANFYDNGPAPFFYNDDFAGQQYGILIFDLSVSPFQADADLTNLFYTVTVQASDVYGNTSLKQFNVQVDAPSVRGINSLACNDTVQVRMDANCFAPLTPDAVLEGLPNACEDRYYVKVAYPYEGHSINTVNKCGIFRYTVFEGDPAVADSDNDTFICWGYVNAEDKTPPTGCINKVVGLMKSPGTATPIEQDGQIVDTDIDADYFGAKDGKKAFKKIEGTFYKYRPVTNEDPEACPNDGIDVKYAPNAADIRLLVCTDADSIFNVPASYQDDEYAYYTGIPQVTDNCQTDGWEPQLVKVTDELRDLQCNYAGTAEMVGGRLISQVILRTFIYEDEKGNRAAIEQKICFFKPIIELPTCKAYFDVCWYGTESQLLPEEIESYPTFVNAVCMRMPVLDHLCNVTVTFEDQNLPGPAKCGDKIIRTWTILDWCWNPLRYEEGIQLVTTSEDCPAPTFSDWKNKKLTWEQHLIIGEEEPPVVLCPEKDEDLYNGSDVPAFSVGPFDCTAAFEVPAPVVKKAGGAEDACNYKWTVEIYTKVPELWHGIPTGNYIIEKFEHAKFEVDIDEEDWTTNSVTVANVPKGAHYFKYKVEDICGKTAYSELCPFYVIDEIEPVAVCNEDLQISIGGEDYARVYASDVDEGSYDNCSNVQLQVRRFLPTECLDAFVGATEWDYSDIYFATNGKSNDADPFILSKANSVNNGAEGYWTPWFDYIDVTCCDVKSQILIELQVWDNANMSVDAKTRRPIFGDEVKPFANYKIKQADNHNICWLEVAVEDKIAPICRAPKDVEIDCFDPPYSLPETSKHTEDGVVWGPEEINDPANALIVEWLNTFNGENGRPAAEDNCKASVEMVKVSFFIHCQAGYIMREFRATDAWGLASQNTCVQKIWVRKVHDYCILFPKDVEAECKEVPEVPGADFASLGCDLLAVSVQDERFNTDIAKGDTSECYKIFRTYRVINWCQFDDELDPDTPLFDRFDTDFDIEPLVVGRDEDCNGWPGDRDVFVRFVGLEDKNGILQGLTFVGFNCNAPINNPPPLNSNRCGLEAWDYTAGFYQYTQIIKVYDKVAPFIDPFGETRFPTIIPDGTTTDKGDVCAGNVSLSFDIVEECTPDDVLIDATLKPDPILGLGPIDLWKNGQVTAEGAAFDFEIPTPDFIDFNLREYKAIGRFPIGQHILQLRAVDGCGQGDTVEIPFEVFDDKAPSPICKAFITATLMPVDENNDGIKDPGAAMQVVWADEYVTSPVGDCSEPVTYSIHRALHILDGTEEPSPDAHSLTVDCSDGDFIQVYVYAWDAAGNSSHCEATLFVQDNQELCGATTFASIAGEVVTDESYAVPEVEIQLTGAEGSQLLTQENGTYLFDGLTPGADYTITPTKDTDHKNGVSTFDLIKISKHILGLEPLESPYKMIAADVNNSKSITTLDLIVTRKLILGVDQFFDNNTSWRFVDAGYTFPEIANPWSTPFPEIINFNDINTNALLKGDFIAVKIGDVTADARVGDLIQPRQFAGQFDLQLEDQDLKAGQTYTIPIYAKELTKVQGFQFTLNVTPDVELLDIVAGAVPRDHFGQIDNALTVSWYQTGNEVAIDEPLFAIKLKAQKSVQVSEVVYLGSQITVAQAYDLNDRLLQPGFDFKSTAGENPFALYQNQPNPFKEATTIGFLLPEAGEVTLTIHDVSGKVLQTIDGIYPKGRNQVTIHSDNMQTGVLYYTLQSGKNIATRRMVLVDRN